MTVYEKAIEMYKHQHERWNHWALFFFGLIASVFVIRNNAQQTIPFSVAALLASILGAAWVCVALIIRATNYSWLLIIQRLEDMTEEDRDKFKLFQEYGHELKRRNHLGDLWETLQVWTREPYRRVTRLITLLGLLMALDFFILFLATVG
jgi:hypothetical protein